MGGSEARLRLPSDAPAGTRQARGLPSLAGLADLVERQSLREDGCLQLTFGGSYIRKGDWKGAGPLPLV